MNPTRIRYVLAAAAAYGAGLVSAAACGDPHPPRGGPAPLVTTRPGQLTGADPPRELRPLTLRVGDDLRQLGQSAADRPAVATVYLEVSGVPVVASYEVGPANP